MEIQKIITTDQIKQVQDNQIIGNIILENSRIDFWGTGNILYCEEPLHLKNAHIQFRGDHSLLYIASTKDTYQINVTMYHHSTCYIGKDTYIHSHLNISVSEQQNFWIGKGCLLSFGTWFRTADPHLIYDCTTHQRMNPSQSIFIGDHVWIGQDCLILKGTKIGSGSIIGGHSVLSHKTIPSNTSYAGNPARKIKNNVYFTPESVHNFKDKDTEKSMRDDTDAYIFQDDTDTISFDEIDKKLKLLLKAEDKLVYLKNLTENTPKNRFYIAS